MRKIDLQPYLILQHKSVDGKPLQFDVKDSLIELLFLEGTMPAKERLNREKLAQIIEAANGQILLEEADWTKLVGGLQYADMKGRHFNEFVRRVYEAPEITVRESE
mgnify:CR=1 FL=1